MKSKIRLLIDSYFDQIKVCLKKLNVTKILIIILILNLFLLTSFVFLKFSLLVTYDGSFYHNYLKYFNNEAALETWPTIRGFSFPLIIYIITKVFSDTTSGFVMGFYVFYIMMLLFTALIIRRLLKENKIKRNQSKYWALYVILFLFNPLIIGYSHTLLTEAVVPFFYILLMYLCLKFKDVTFKENKIKFLFLSFLLIFISVFVWFIKQPYAPTIWMALLLTSLLSGIMNKSFKQFLSKFIVFVLALAFTVIGISSWNTFLKGKSQVEIENPTSSLLSNSLLGSNINFKRVLQSEVCNIEYINSIDLSEKERSKIEKLISSNENWCSYIRVYNILDLEGKYVESKVLIQKDTVVSTKESIGFYLSSIFSHPILFLHAYVENYLTILNFEETYIEPEIGYMSTGKIIGNSVHENNNIAYIVFHEGYKNCWWQWENEINDEAKELVADMKGFEGDTNTNSNLSPLMQILQQFSNITFMFGLLISFPVFIFGIIMCFIRKDNNSYFMITVLSGSAFMNIFFHIMMSALIDRYCYPVYPLMLLCIIIMFMDKKNIKLKKNNIKLS